MGWWQRSRLALAVAALLGVAGGWPAHAASIRRIAVEPGPRGVAVVVVTDEVLVPAVSALRTGPEAVQRIYLDYPAGTGVPRGARVRRGRGAVRAVRVGLTDGARVRVAIDVAGAPDFLIRRAAPSTLTVIVGRAGEAGEQHREVTPRRRLRVAIDPGHGGEDPGASGYVLEKDVTLEIAQALAGLLEKRLGAEVILTRDDDTTVRLADRTQIANRARADLLVSIHANASENPEARGVETYYLDNTEDQATLRLATLENRDVGGSQAAGTSLDHILSSLVQGAKHAPSIELAQAVQSNLMGQLTRDWTGVIDLGVKRGPFYVLVGAYMPCVLVETSFLSHRDEGRRLSDPAYRAAIARGIYAGIVHFMRARSEARTL